MNNIIRALLYFIYYVENKETTEISLAHVTNADKYSNGTEDNSMKGLKVITRAEWGARPPKEPANNLILYPPSHVVLHHSGSDGCTSQSTCSALIRSRQNLHMDHYNWSDISYNFLIGEDGNVYEGLGWGKMGERLSRFDHRSIGICIIGNFNSREPNSSAIETLKDLIKFGVSDGEIQSNYKLIGHRQISASDCPGDRLYNLIKNSSHFVQNPYN
ncbi:peptidoglycan-recognition protein SC2-like [Leptopilina heterotoma]|uniref:peptidoglycan-recognition protein SC2-like n=1 Tax=Leptopilina heterotoma TaxID=63436 RepID=UPI001CA7BB57|nr:peptidoglycan-recognition protein SC2-like [Leptopilina heterotoma]